MVIIARLHHNPTTPIAPIRRLLRPRLDQREPLLIRLLPILSLAGLDFQLCHAGLVVCSFLRLAPSRSECESVTLRVSRSFTIILDTGIYTLVFNSDFESFSES